MNIKLFSCTGCGHTNVLNPNYGKMFKCQKCKEVSIVVGKNSVLFENSDSFGFYNLPQLKSSLPTKTFISTSTILFSIIILLSTVLSSSFEKLSKLANKSSNNKVQ